jgi:hypothetical protein
MNRAGEKQAVNFLIEIVNEMDVWIGGVALSTAAAARENKTTAEGES